MGRRQFLKSSLAAITAGLAGCSVLTDSEDVEETYEPSAEAQLATAVGKLNKAALAVSRFQDQNSGNEDGDESNADSGETENSESGNDSETRRTFDASGPRERITAAREAITAAEDAGVPAEDVTAVTQYADSVEGTVDSVESVTTAGDHLDEARDILDSEDVDTDAASAVLDDATTASGDAQTRHSDAASALDTADSERLEALDAGAEALDSGLDSLFEFVVGVDGLARGYETQVGGIDDLQTAQDHIDADEFDTAKTAFGDAQTDLTAAGNIFTDTVADAAADLEDDLTEGDQRSRSLERLSAGYVSLLDSRDHIKTAESAIEDDSDASGRTELNAGSEDANAALKTFDEGDGILEDEFTSEFNTARTRANAVDTLAVGNLELLDGREFLEDGESAFLDERFDEAKAAFENAETESDQAETTFTDGQETDDEGLFEEEFDDALQRTSVLRSLSEGYASVVQGREEADEGRQALDDENFETAESQFQTAAATFDDAETTFSEGQADAGDQFDDALNRALCQVGHLKSATDHFIAAAQAGSSRDRSTFEDERDAGETDLDRVEEC